MRKFGALILGVAALWLVVPSLSAQQPDRNVLVLFRSRPNQNDAAAVQRAGGRIKYTYGVVNAMAVSMPAQAIDGLSRNPNIEIIEPDYTATINADPDYAAELNGTWGVKKIGAGDAQLAGYQGVGIGGPINVAVIDTGINCSHPELTCGSGWDFVNSDGNPSDDNGHGTHVAGTIGAHRDGVGVVGVAPLVILHAVKVLDANGSGSYADIIAGVDWAWQNGMQVTNNSYGGSGNSLTLERAFQNAAAAGVVSVAAAGNSGTVNGSGDNMGYPGKYNSVISVAATDINDVRASFSSTGPRLEIAAPGVNIKSTSYLGGYVDGWSGTSMATPHVVGVAALLLGKGVVNSNGDLTPGGAAKINDEVRNTLALTALDLGTSGRDTKYGFGRVRVMDALNYGAVPASSGIVSIEYAAQPGRGRDMTITVSAIYKPVVPLVGADVTISVNLGTGYYGTVTGTTGPDGSVSFTLKNAPSGVYTTTVTNVVGGGLTFDGVTPANSFNKK